MTIGPIQLLVLGFNKPDFQGEIAQELQRLADDDAVRLIDSLMVYKDADGETAVLQASNLSPEHAAEVGAVIGGLLGLGEAGEEGAVEGAMVGAAAMETGEGVFSPEQVWDVVEDIPNDTAAALLLLEHRWAMPFRDAVGRAGGFRISDGFVSPLDLIEVGLVAAEEAEALAAMEAQNRRPDAAVQGGHDARTK
jgi:uncharacterized membrane protein